MKAVITGATGLLGGNVAIALLERGHDVVAIKRPTSETDHLAGFDIEWADASLSDVDGLARAFEGADVVFHCAAAVSVRVEVQPWIHAANVTGTENVLAAFRASGAGRLVHTSSVGAVGLSEDGEPCDETATWNMPEYGLGDAYVTTKKQAQDIALGAARDGADVVIVNPTYMLGPYDARPSSGALIVNVARRKVPGYTLGKNNFVDVRDVARGMVAAADKGRAGEMYILGGHNMSYKEIMDTISEVAGTRPIEREIRPWLARLVGWGGEFGAKLSKNEPLVNTATVRWAQTPRFIFRSDKACRELGYEISPIAPAIADAIDWFRKRRMM